jgi:N-acyl homoserine lactone hydrolase
LLACVFALPTLAQTPEVSLTRLDCGNEPEPANVASFSDTYAYTDFKVQLAYSCYLIRHGDEYMLWDAGLAVGSAPEAPKTSLVELLKQVGVAPAQMKYVGISHYHYDHIGQAASFPGSTLLIGKGDWDALRQGQSAGAADAEELASRARYLAPWISGGGKVEALSADKKDIFGDGTVVMLNMTGHTPGHHSLLVKLAKTGNVLLTGDVTHFRENYENDGIPRWNSNRADSLASLNRFKQIAKNLRATVIIQHDPRDVSKLPAFPAAAE